MEKITGQRCAYQALLLSQRHVTFNDPRKGVQEYEKLSFIIKDFNGKVEFLDFSSKVPLDSSLVLGSFDDLVNGEVKAGELITEKGYYMRKPHESFVSFTVK